MNASFFNESTTETMPKLLDISQNADVLGISTELLKEMRATQSGQRFLISQRFDFKHNLRQVMKRKFLLVGEKAEVRRYIILKTVETYGLMYESFLFGLFLGTKDNPGTNRAKQYKRTWGITATQRMQEAFDKTPFKDKYATTRKKRYTPYRDLSGQMSASANVTVSYFRNYGLKYSASIGDFKDIGYKGKDGKWRRKGKRYYYSLTQMKGIQNLVAMFLMDDWKFTGSFRKLYKSMLGKYGRMKSVSKSQIDQLNRPGPLRSRLRE